MWGTSIERHFSSLPDPRRDSATLKEIVPSILSQIHSDRITGEPDHSKVVFGKTSVGRVGTVRRDDGSMAPLKGNAPQ